jgi:hypothetical protein
VVSPRFAITEPAPTLMGFTESFFWFCSCVSWSLRFHIPIALPDGRDLLTLRDAGEYIQSLSKAKHRRPEWLLAVEMLIAAVEERGSLMFAEIAVRKAVNTGKPEPAPEPRRKRTKKYR